MIRRQFLALAAAAVALLPFGAPKSSWAQQTDPENTLIMELRDGRVVIAMRPDLAPTHVARIKELTRKGFYDGSVFHRVIRGFMAQVGDPTGTGGGGSGQKLRAEFSREPHRRGTVSMARTSDPNSADSQFFICFDDTPHLNGQYTVWGRVVSGMEFVDNIKKGAPGSGAVTDPDRIVRMRVAADVK
jgi:peptidylprolyl isomerase